MLIVEDEPAAMRFITSLIETRCSGFHIVGKAENGREAMALLQSTPTDIVITDIQMSPVDGIELAEWIHRERPTVLTVIISGHSDFAYAKSAIQSGVVEYLLKPIIPADFSAVMQRLQTRIRCQQRDERSRSLGRMAQGADAEAGPTLWDCQSYWLMAVRLGGDVSDLAIDDFCDKDLDDGGALILAPGRDCRDLCLALPGHLERKRVMGVMAHVTAQVPFYTALLSKQLLTPPFTVMPDMLFRLDEWVVPGLSQTLVYPLPPVPNRQIDSQEQHLLKKLRYEVVNALGDSVKETFVALFCLWEEHHQRLVLIEPQLQQLVMHIYDHVPRQHGLSPRDIALHVSAACKSAVGFPDLLGKIWSLCQEELMAFANRSETGRRMESIEHYIQEHLGDPLGTRSVCALFGISTSYLSQLFRRHLDMTFIEYVTQRRVEEAKKLMKDFPARPLKDIAISVGFSDQFYFSKVFRAITGVPPSEYRSRESV